MIEIRHFCGGFLTKPWRNVRACPQSQRFFRNGGALSFEDPIHRGGTHASEGAVKKKANRSASKTTAKKSALGKRQKKRAGKAVSARKSGRKRASTGILKKAKDALKTVIAGAASGARKALSPELPKQEAKL
jgi:hypothetical protein